ncbi:MAG: hypothetical protein QM586_09930 [Xenophilus sp.]
MQYIAAGGAPAVPLGALERIKALETLVIGGQTPTTFAARGLPQLRQAIGEQLALASTLFAAIGAVHTLARFLDGSRPMVSLRTAEMVTGRVSQPNRIEACHPGVSRQRLQGREARRSIQARP